MKLREIILDFTSLLDVIMIILFWFILNYQSETTKIRDQAQAAQQAASEAQVIAEERQAQAEELRQTAQDELEALAQADERQASILSAMMEYRQGRSLNLTLVNRSSYWYLEASIGTDESLGRVYDEDEKRIGLELNRMLDAAGFAPDDTIFCVFSYDSSAPGSREAYRSVTRELKNMQLGNNQFSYTEIDRAIPEEETT